MAASQDIRDLVTCTLCFEEFNSSEKLPKCLPCSHTFCLECMEKFVKEKFEFQLPCPLCQVRFTVPRDGVKAIPTNIMVKQLLESIPKESEKKESIQGRGEVHKKEAGEFMCVPCNLPLCSKCMVEVQKGPHSGHELAEMETMFKALSCEMQALSNEGLALQRENNEMLKKNMEDVDKVPIVYNQKAEDRATNAHAEVDKWLKDTKAKIDASFNKSKPVIRQQHHDLTSHYNALEKSLDIVNAKLASGDVTTAASLLEAVKVKKLTRSRLQLTDVNFGVITDMRKIELCTFESRQLQFGRFLSN